MKRVITYGTFDLLHYGHINLLRQAKALGDYLVVGVSTDGCCESKGKRCYFSLEDRMTMIKAIRYVDLVIPEQNMEQKIEDVKKLKIDIFTLGDDYSEKFKLMLEYKAISQLCQIIYLPRTPEISSSKIKIDIMKSSYI